MGLIKGDARSLDYGSDTRALVVGTPRAGIPIFGILFFQD